MDGYEAFDDALHHRSGQPILAVCRFCRVVCSRKAEYGNKDENQFIHESIWWKAYIILNDSFIIQLENRFSIQETFLESQSFIASADFSHSEPSIIEWSAPGTILNSLE